jgi:ferredoxin
MIKRLDKVKRGEPFTIRVDDDVIIAYEGETLATALLASGKEIIRRTLKDKSPRSYYCGMGICNECLVTLENGNRVRACQTFAAPSLKVKTHE